jgi:hypothetical protein
MIQKMWVAKDWKSLVKRHFQPLSATGSKNSSAVGGGQANWAFPSKNA